MEKEKLRVLRKLAMLSQEEFAKEIGVSQRTVSKWELGIMGIGYKNQRKIVAFAKNHGIEIEKL